MNISICDGNTTKGGAEEMLEEMLEEIGFQHNFMELAIKAGLTAIAGILFTGTVACLLG